MLVLSGILCILSGASVKSISFVVPSSKLVLKSGDGVCILRVSVSWPTNAPLDIISLVSATIILPVMECEKSDSNMFIYISIKSLSTFNTTPPSDNVICNVSISKSPAKSAPKKEPNAIRLVSPLSVTQTLEQTDQQILDLITLFFSYYPVVVLRILC